jgi:hypothetical protein
MRSLRTFCLVALALVGCDDGSSRHGTRDSGASDAAPSHDSAPVRDAVPGDAAPIRDAAPGDAAPIRDAAPSDAAPLRDAAPADAAPPDAQPPADRDGDGVPDVTDLCPDVADPGQADADGDGAGDACDPQPAVYNVRLVRQALLVLGGAGMGAAADLDSAANAGRHTAVGGGLRLEGRLSP